MKTIVTQLFICISFLGFTQTSINYKALIKDASGDIIVDNLIQVQFTIYKTSENGTLVYQETHSPTTDSNGLIILDIGQGTAITGTFALIDWISDLHYLNVQINTGSGLVDMGTSQFSAVPYAYAARTASNVFSGDYNDLNNLPTIVTPDGLEEITENGDTGWRLIGKDPNNYGDIGMNAVDLSQSTIASSSHGATNTAAVAFGTNTISSGFSSAAFGSDNDATGSSSVAMGQLSLASGNVAFSSGFRTKAESYSSAVFGRNNVGGGASNFWEDSDPLFEIGNGLSDANRNNAFTVLKNGRVGINDATPNYLFDILNIDKEPRSISIFHSGSNPDAGTQMGIFLNVEKPNTNIFGTAYGVRSQTQNNLGDGIALYGWGRNFDTSSGDAFGLRALVGNEGGSGVAYGVYASLTASTTSGDIYAGYFAGDVFTTGSYLPSDENLKDDIRLAEDSALAKLMNLTVENYIYKNDRYKDMRLPRGLRTGFTAQNVERIMPELVQSATQPAPTKEEIEAGAQLIDDIHFKAVDYAGMVPYLVKAIQELKTENEALRARIEALEDD